MVQIVLQTVIGAPGNIVHWLLRTPDDEEIGARIMRHGR
jgi:hypothetical protein